MRLNRILGLVLTAVTALAASGAQAAPITLTADPSSNFSLGISAGGLGNGSNSGQITGSMNTDIDLTPTITDGTGSFSVANFSITGLLLGTLTIQNFHITVTNPSSVTGTGSNPYNVDIAGAVVSVDAGQVVLNGSNSGQITGSMNTDIDLTPTITDGTGSFSVANFTITGLLLGPLTIQNFHITVTNPSSVTGTGSNPYNVDIGGAVVSVDGGQVVLGGSTLFNFNTSPTVVTAPPGSNSTLTLGASSTTWSIPFTTTSTLSTLGIPVNITIGTQLNLTGPAVVPEPGTVMLVGAGLVGLVAAGRRKKA